MDVKLTEINTKLLELTKLRDDMIHKLNLINADINKLEKDKKPAKENIEFFSMNTGNEFKNYLLNENELFIISEGMYKTDYTYTKSADFEHMDLTNIEHMDLTNITNFVKTLYNIHATWKLKKLEQLQFSPPTNYYKYYFTDSNNNITYIIKN